MSDSSSPRGVAVLVSLEPERALRLAKDWASGGDAVTLVLLDGAVGAARPGHPLVALLSQALADGVTVTAHDEALRRRALRIGGLVDGVKPVDLDEVADLVAEGAEKVVWL